MTLGDRIKHTRKARGMKQSDLATEAKVRPALVSELEGNKKFDTMAGTVMRLARVLGVSVDYLVGMYDSETEAQHAAS